MADYHLKDWLTIEEAAAWLTDRAGKDYTTDAVERALYKGILWPYYYPQRGQLGLFRRQLHTENHTVKPAGQPLRFIGPVTLYDYAGFKESAARRPTALIGSVLGKTVGPPPEEDEYTYFDDAVYLIGENNEAASLTSQPYKILIRARDLEAFSVDPEPLPRPIYRTFPGVWGACIDIHADEALTPGIDHPLSEHPLSEHPPGEQGQKVKDDLPAIKALAFAIHLIADIADQFDTHRFGEDRPERSLRLKTKSSRKPNPKRIAEQLKETATRLKSTGHGYGESGFYETLRRALNELGPD